MHVPSDATIMVQFPTAKEMRLEILLKYTSIKNKPKEAFLFTSNAGGQGGRHHYRQMKKV